MKIATKFLLVCLLLAFIIAMTMAQETPETNTNTNDDEELVFEDDDDDESFSTYQDEGADDEVDPTQFMSEDEARRREAQNLGYVFPSPDVEVSYVQPNNPTNNIMVGKKQAIVLGFTNNGLNAFNIYGIRGFVYHSKDYQYVIQNFTAIRYNTTVQPEETNSVLYEYYPDPRLETVEFGLALQVFYMNEDNDTFAHTFFNQTVNFVENDEVFDTQQLYLYITIAAIAGAAFYFGKDQCLGGKKSTSRSSYKSNTATRSSSPTSTGSPSGEEDKDIDYSFVSARHVHMANKQKKKKKKKN